MHRKITIRLVFISISLILIVVGFRLSSAAGSAHASVDDSPQQEPTVNLPTSTATVVGGPTATPSRTPTISPVLVETLGEVNLRKGPGLNFDIVATIPDSEVGTRLPVVGRSAFVPWLQVLWEEAPDGRAWLYEPIVIVVSGDITTVPIVDEPELPTQDPTEVSIQQTATVLLQTPGAVETATATAFLRPTGIYTVTPGGPAVAGGSLPTFTPINDVDNNGVIVPPQNPTPVRRGPAPAVIIISLGLMGLLTLGMGLLRRL